MAARPPRRDDEDALDPVEAADVEAEDEDEDVLELEPDLVDEADDVDADDLGDDLAGTEEDLAADEELVADDDLAADDALAAETLDVPVAFDDDEDALVAAVAAEDDDDEGAGVDGVKPDEFICRSCHLAKAETQLADPERLLCRDCA